MRRLLSTHYGPIYQKMWKSGVLVPQCGTTFGSGDGGVTPTARKPPAKASEVPTFRVTPGSRTTASASSPQPSSVLGQVNVQAAPAAA